MRPDRRTGTLLSSPYKRHGADGFSPMNAPKLNEYLVISRGQWDADASPETIQAAIDRFYDWLDAHVAAGCMRRGSRLTREVALVTRKRTVTDGPFAEIKELIGGYWFVLAPSLEAAAQLPDGAAGPVLRSAAAGSGTRQRARRQQRDARPLAVEAAGKRRIAFAGALRDTCATSSNAGRA